jgi:hypothetical protein
MSRFRSRLAAMERVQGTPARGCASCRVPLVRRVRVDSHTGEGTPEPSPRCESCGREMEMEIVIERIVTTRQEARALG